MIYLPPLRRFLLPALVFVVIIIFYRATPFHTRLPSFVLHSPPAPPTGVRIAASTVEKPLPISINATANHLSPPNSYYYSYDKGKKPSTNDTNYILWQPILDPHLDTLFQCPMDPNEVTGHLRLVDNIVQNISQIPPGSLKPESRVFWNPTVIALPYWSENQYLVVSRIVTDGNHQENVLCEANVCYVPGQEAKFGEKPCTDDDLMHVGPGGGMRCASPPALLSVPPTPAEKCVGKFAPYVDIPGFHDPRIFWSGKGEPLMMVNTQWAYCLPTIFHEC